MKEYPHTKNIECLKQIPLAEIVRVNVKERSLEILKIEKGRVELSSSTPLIINDEKELEELVAPFYILSSTEDEFEIIERKILEKGKGGVGVYICRMNIMSPAEVIFGRDYPCDNEGNPKKSDGPGVVFVIAKKIPNGDYMRATHLMCPSFTDILTHIF